MRISYIAATALAALLPTTTLAEFSWEGSAVIGAGNNGLKNGPYGILTATGTQETTLDNGFVASASATLTGRSYRAHAEYLESDYLTFDLGLDMGKWGKLSLGNQREVFPQLPWADGILFNFGSTPVFPVTQMPFRTVDDTFVLLEDGVRKKTRPLATLRYENETGPVTYSFNFKVLDRYIGGFREDELSDEVPWIDGRVSVKTGFGTYAIRANDLRDYGIAAEYAIAPGMKLEFFHDVRDADRDVRRNAAVLIYRRPQDQPGLFRGFRAGLYESSTTATALAGVTFGKRDWQIMLAADKTEGLNPNFAIEGNYKLSEKMTLYGAFDGGFDRGEGRDPFLAPPFSAPARDSAFEVALKIDF